MGDHLRIDVDAIASSARAVKAVRDELASAEEIADGAHVVLGDVVLADRLRDFATNWTRHRTELCQDLDTFSSWAAGAAKAYRDTDDGLAKALQEGRRSEPPPRLGAGSGA